MQPKKATPNNNQLLEQAFACFNEGMRLLQQIQKQQVDEKWLTATEFAKENDVKRDTIALWRRQGRLLEGVHWKYVGSTARKPSYRYKSKSLTL
jgi:hypothetical protein